MAKAKIMPAVGDGFPRAVFECPGCKRRHVLPVVMQRPHLPGTWFFDGNLDSPTIEPSLRVLGGVDGKQTVCHIVITAGRIHYQGDDTHFPGQVSGMLDLKQEDDL